MADIVTPRDLPNELVTITNDATLFEVYNPDQSRNEKVEMSTLLSYIAGSELATLTVLGDTVLARDGGNVIIGADGGSANLVVNKGSGINSSIDIGSSGVGAGGNNAILIFRAEPSSGSAAVVTFTYSASSSGTGQFIINNRETMTFADVFTIKGHKVGIMTIAPGQIFDVNQGSGNMIADGYDNHSLAAYKEDVKNITIDYLKNLSDCPPKIWKRKPHIPAEEIRDAAIEEFGGAEWLKYFPKDTYRNGAIADMPESSMKTWIDAWCDSKRITMRQEPKWQRDFVGIIADDTALQEKLPELIAIDDEGITSGISLGDYIGVLHASIIQLNDRIKQLEQ